MRLTFILVALVISGNSISAFAFTDEDIRMKLVGRWSGEARSGSVVVKGTHQFMPNGEFTVQAIVLKPGMAAAPVNLKGTWRVINGFVVDTVTESDNQALAPIGDSGRDKVIHIDGETYVHQNESGKVKTDRRLK